MPEAVAAPATPFPNAAPTAPTTPKAPVAPKVVKAAPEAKPDAMPVKDPAETQQAAEERWRLKGRKGEREYTRADLERKLQIADGVEERLTKAEALERADAEWKNDFKKRGLAAAREAAEKNGVADFDKQIEDYLIEKYKKANKPNDKGEWEPKSPEEIELEELRQYKAKASEAETKTKAEREAAAREQEIAALSEQYTKEVKPILAKLGYDPKVSDALIVPLVSDVMLAADAKGVTLTTDQAVAESRELIGDFFTSHLTGMTPADFKGTIGAAIQSRMGDASGAELIELVGQPIVKKILTHLQEQLRGGPAPQRASEETPRAPRMSRQEEADAARDMMVFGQRMQR